MSLLALDLVQVLPCALLLGRHLSFLDFGPAQLVLQVLQALFLVGLVVMQLLLQLLDVLLSQRLVQVHLVDGVAQEELGSLHHGLEAEVSRDLFAAAATSVRLLRVIFPELVRIRIIERLLDRIQVPSTRSSRLIYASFQSTH